MFDLESAKESLRPRARFAHLQRGIGTGFKGPGWYYWFEGVCVVFGPYADAQACVDEILKLLEGEDGDPLEEDVAGDRRGAGPDDGSDVFGW